MKKIGIDNIFCKLDSILYLDSAAVNIYPVKSGSNEIALITTKKGSIYRL